MQWTAQSAQQLLKHFNVIKDKGLNAKRAERTQKKVGPNKIIELAKRSYWSYFLEQFNNFMVLVLLAATVISFVLGEYVDSFAIICILISNAALGFMQEIKSERSLMALKRLSAPLGKVLRDGVWQRIDAEQLVPGDLVRITSGDRVPADIRFLEVDGLYVDESALTGESCAIRKTEAVIYKSKLALGDRKNMAYMGTMVTKGNGLGLVVETGMQTEMGKIAHLLQTTHETVTPLQLKLEQMGKLLVIISLFLTVVVVGTGVWHGQDFYRMFLTGVSLAVAAIPEGLPAIVTVALALGVQRMIKKKAIVRKLPSVETLGCATVICSDKTGTLTQNQMTVTDLWVEGKRLQVTGGGYDLEGSFLNNGQEVQKIDRMSGLSQLLKVAVYCNNANIIKSSSALKLDGDPTEAALLILANKAGLKETEGNKIREFAFDSARKMMSVVWKVKEEKVLYVKGAPDILLGRCTHILRDSRRVILTRALREEVLAINEQFAKKALRNLGFAFRTLNHTVDITNEHKMEQELTFIGITGMIDPPREEVAASIDLCQRAGIKTVMITGDHRGTAQAVADKIGIGSKENKLLTGYEIEEMSAEELYVAVEETSIYARVSPEHKLRIVKALQHNGHVVSMTGDGVNDAPAIRAADIGVSMGVMGTDVSKEAADLVLADDNFATIVAAIKEGRAIYDNIRKFISYLLASNVGEILIMFLTMLFGMPLPLLPTQILWVNLVTDGLPAMALAVDPAEGGTMCCKPRNRRESIFARAMGWKIITRGFLIGLCSLLAFTVTYYQDPLNLPLAQTVAFSTLVFAQLVYVFDARTNTTIFDRNPFNNKMLLLAVGSSALLMLVVIYYPSLQQIFHTVPLGFREWLLVTITSSLPVIIAGLCDQCLLAKRTT
ncbi:MAG: hypothetical protein RLZ12_293 [Bacillota bacterium]